MRRRTSSVDDHDQALDDEPEVDYRTDPRVRISGDLRVLYQSDGSRGAQTVGAQKCPRVAVQAGQSSGEIFH